MRELSRFRVRDSMGNTYEIVEYSGADGSGFKTSDGYAVEQLDRTNYVIKKRNPRTNEPQIEVHR